MAVDEANSSVLFLLSCLTMGGSERKTVRLANALAERGCRTAIAYLNGPQTLASEIQPAVPVTCLRREGRFSFTALRRLVWLVRTSRVQTLVAVNLYAALYAVLAKLLVRGGRLRVYVSINTTEFATRKEARQMALYRWILRGADGLIFGADSQRKLWRARYHLPDTQPCIVLYNGVDTEYFSRACAPSFAIGTGLPRRLGLISVGKLRREKAHVDMVRALSAVRAEGIDASALVVGDGPERAAIEAEIARLGLREHASVTGEMRDVRALLASADIFVLPSTTETFSNAVLEAMSMELPVIAARVGGMGEMLAFGGGLTYAPGDVRELCACIRALSQDAAARSRLAAEARRAAVERFGWQKMIDAFCEQVLHRGAPASGTKLC